MKGRKTPPSSRKKDAAVAPQGVAGAQEGDAETSDGGARARGRARGAARGAADDAPRAPAAGAARRPGGPVPGAPRVERLPRAGAARRDGGRALGFVGPGAPEGWRGAFVTPGAARRAGGAGLADAADVALRRTTKIALRLVAVAAPREKRSPRRRHRSRSPEDASREIDDVLASIRDDKRLTAIRAALAAAKRDIARSNEQTKTETALDDQQKELEDVRKEAQAVAAERKTGKRTSRSASSAS